MIFTTNYSRKILFFLAVFLSCFKGFSQKKVITLHIKNEPISLIIKQIEEQSDYRIIYNAKKIDADQKVSIDVTKASLETTLTQLFKGKNISFYIQKKQILLTNSAPSTTDRSEEKDRYQETERTIKGIVLNASDKSPLPGATIFLKGTGRGAISDFDGRFFYNLKGNNISDLVLEVQHLGMHIQTQKVENKTEFIFYMEETTDELNQVIITSSYGTKKLKEEIVGSISTITAKDIPIQQASESIDKMLEGQIAGVLIENTSGVGGPVKINIRGQGTIKALNNSILGTSTQPLIIVDGVIMSEQTGIDNEFFDGGRLSESLSNPLAMISADNIEDLTVLKDAAAVGIYGADGANGVILITTKKGKLGKAKFTFSNQLGVSSAINQIKYLNGEQYTELRNEYLKNTEAKNAIPYNGINTDWFDLLNNNGIYNKYNFSVSGATSKFSYRSSLAYLSIEEPQLGNTTKQLNGGINLGFRDSKWNINLSVNPSYIKKDAPNTFYDFAYIPTLSPYNQDGSYTMLGVSGGNTGGNPFAAIAQNKNETDTFGILGSFNVGYELSKYIKFNTLFGINYVDKNQDRWFSGENESGQNNGTFILDGISHTNWGRRLLHHRNTTRWNWQGQMLFDKKINKKNSIDGVLGFELAEEKGNFNSASASGFVNPTVIHSVEESLQDDNPDTPLDESRTRQVYRNEINNSSMVSLFTQINYNYNKKYYALVNIRRDQSSVFGEDSDVAYNSGAGLAWITSNENFLKSNSWIDFLKLKISYGSTGNSRIGSYRSKGLYVVSQNGYNGSIDAKPSSSPNGKLSWEKNLKFNAGIDFNVFNTVELSLDYYQDNKEDMITSRNIPTELGYGTVQLNASSMYNKGFELTTRIKWFQKEKFKWTSTFNISTVNNKVTDLIGLGSTYSTSNLALAQKIGYSTTTIWGVNWVGVDPATGRDLIKKNGQVYDAATYDSLFTEADWEPIGDTQPKAFGGFSNTISFNNSISLSIVGAFQWGGQTLISDQLISKTNTTSNRNMSVNAYDYWRNPGDIVSQPSPSNNTLIANMSKYIFDASFIKINNINLSYNVPVKKSFIDALTVFGDVSNVLYWYKEKSPSGMNGIREFNYTYPQARTVSCGINAKF